MDVPALKLLLQGYLNIDWDDEYADAWAAVDDFLASEGLAPTLQAELRTVLETIKSEADLDRLIMDELDSGYKPFADGWTHRDWLLALLERASRPR